ncbi:hypothetical protein JCM21531_616 [Acetivibrio straminisolvens JCM 21531]|uniref:Uncharacterized protein n=1 Tax=Acetivibrio straminisolvens JCM 21531 TaxID=1294263 RepID=W4V215_9FIRM|nr:hypothetical protein JCM21531_616 [Acetivibrio straminisolvens JCM 21531]
MSSITVLHPLTIIRGRITTIIVINKTYLTNLFIIHTFSRCFVVSYQQVHVSTNKYDCKLQVILFLRTMKSSGKDNIIMH